MQPFTVHTGRAVPLRRSNVDTDQIIPAVYLKRISRTGFADGLFAAWRRDPGFVLNRPEHAGGSILVAGPDFGTGSSREHAVWALHDFGFRAVLSARFADIFLGNAAKGGLLAAQLHQADIEALWDRIEAAPQDEMVVDLHVCEVRAGALRLGFTIDPYTRWRLLEGLDDIDLTLRHDAAVSDFERGRAAWLPALSAPGSGT
ncbi:MAG: 3-isopropylmalate dehydratase small subunit [Sporichthyaceae bacterium]|nr:3-isopropylmalate dehydratase small subunit [Sporichthyaceae bacterium]